jgi:hypothetical protein
MRENAGSMKTWSASQAELAGYYLLFDIASGFRGGNRVGDNEKAAAYTEAYQTVLAFIWQRGFKGEALDNTEQLPGELMPQFFKSRIALPISPIEQSQLAHLAMIVAMRRTLTEFADNAKSARDRNQHGWMTNAINDYWHAMRIGWDFGWRPTDLKKTEKLPDELMPDYYRAWHEGDRMK